MKFNKPLKVYGANIKELFTMVFVHFIQTLRLSMYPRSIKYAFDL